MQHRSRATVQVILEAAARVLGRESLAGFNTNRVAEVAGISVGSLYQYFPNKEALVAALIDHAQEELAQAVESAVASLAHASLHDSLQALAELAVRQQYQRPLLAAALDHEERRLPLQARLRETQARVLGSVQTLLQRHGRRIRRPANATTARDCLLITQALVEADADGRHLPPADLQQRVVLALLGYLTVAGENSRS